MAAQSLRNQGRRLSSALSNSYTAQAELERVRREKEAKLAEADALAAQRIAQLTLEHGEQARNVRSHDFRLREHVDRAEARRRARVVHRVRRRLGPVEHAEQAACLNEPLRNEPRRSRSAATSSRIEPAPWTSLLVSSASVASACLNET